ncbi:DUF1615 domain-containing protein [Stenotrophomonas sp. SY1]|uniref:DUF1615 domain-containing protein n=1 Tax=Stenotrophomonas sp. SY1 TaxID=477235 RepID=UPI001E59B772|nr:DUF1615 domain-containing protein [Stenotrophomonas sp. SY1]MCD9087274.1 DUF1615 domain-containing protein [Stenotrophomonas sp. SY1]
MGRVIGMPRRVLLGGLPLAVLTACSTVPGPAPDDVGDVVRRDIERRIPGKVDDRKGWAGDIQTALATQRITPNPENICAVLAVIEQETGYRADPEVANLPRIARREIDRRASAKRVPALLVDAGLRIKAADGRSYSEKLAAVRTEHDLSRLYEEIIDRVPMGRRLFAGQNPVQTGGAMQVSIPFAQEHAQGYPYPVRGSIREEVFSRRGGIYFGTMHLLGYQTPYTRKVHRFADYNAGWYASRNAAFQNAASVATGVTLALDGDLLVPGAPLDKPGQTERAVRQLGGELRMDDAQIRRALEQADQLDFSSSDIHTRVFAIAESRSGTPLPRAVIPGIRLDSPKITRELTTEWFANRVDERYRQCLQR